MQRNLFWFPNYVYLRPIKYRTYHAHILMKKPRMDENVLYFKVPALGFVRSFGLSFTI
jgi:hypothetical protein